MKLLRAVVPAAAALFVLLALLAGPRPAAPATGSADVTGTVTSSEAEPPPAPAPPDSLLAGVTRVDRGGGATVVVIWLTPAYLRVSPERAEGFDPQRYLLFRIAIASPSFKLSVWDLKGMIYLQDGGGKEYGTPVWMPDRDGAWKSGLAAFPSKDARGNPIPSAESRHIRVLIRGLGDVNERVFTWELDRS